MWYLASTSKLFAKYFGERMKQLCEFFYDDSSRIAKPAILEQVESLHDACAMMAEHGFVRVLHDQSAGDEINELASKFSDVELVVVVGMGGSTLGLQALYQVALADPECVMREKLQFIDTVDTDKFIGQCDQLGKRMERDSASVLFVIISKSGTTVETIANLMMIESMVKNLSHTEQANFVCITGHDSPLWEYAAQHSYSRLPIPTDVGGRYSVLTAVGLFPLAVLGVDIAALHEAARSVAKVENGPVISAAIRYLEYRQSRQIHDLFLFSAYLESFGKWSRQLIAESLGKKHDCSGKEVCSGITPIVSIGTQDLHSMAQLYFAGPRDKFTTFISVEKSYRSANFSDDVWQQSPFERLGGKPYSCIMKSVEYGTKKAYTAEGMPFISFVCEQASMKHVVYLMQWMMMETVLLGTLLEVNPFDQPGVETYKRELRGRLQDV